MAEDEAAASATAVSLLDHLRSKLAAAPPCERLWIAYSGGLDSRVLLDLCGRLRRAGEVAQLAAVHVHHGLLPVADAFAEHCREVCRHAEIPFHLIPLQLDARPGESLEEIARRARYDALRKLVTTGEILLTAQHCDDQAETLLLQLLRGAGVAGLAAMPDQTDLGKGRLLRPLLGISRTRLLAYAEHRRLQWIEDPSNEDLRFDRNFVRHRVMPLLRQRWPAAAEALSRSASHCAEAKQCLDRLGQDLLASVLNPTGTAIEGDRLRGLTPVHQRLVIRHWLRSRGFRVPSVAVLRRILDEALTARPDRNPVIAWPEGQVRRYRTLLYLLSPLPPFDASVRFDWDGREALVLPDGNGRLIPVLRPGPGLSPEFWHDAEISIRYRRGGEGLRLAGRGGTHSLKKLLQEARIPPWIRPRIPLLFMSGRLAAVAGLWLAAEFSGRASESNYQLHWQPPSPLAETHPAWASNPRGEWLDAR